MSTQDRIASIIRTVSEKPTLPAEDESLFESGFLDSFALPDLIGALESEFTIKIPDSDLNPRKFDSLARITSYIEAKV